MKYKQARILVVTGCSQHASLLHAARAMRCCMQW